MPWPRRTIKEPGCCSKRTRAIADGSLNSKHPFDPPRVNFNYFEHDQTGALTPDAEKDLRAMSEGVDIINLLMKGSRHRLRVHPGIMKGVDLETEWGKRQFVQDRAWGHLSSSTCKIGAEDDPDTVLDSRFRVRGVKGLHVDVSVFPKFPASSSSCPST